MGAGSDRPPVVATLRWQGSAAGPDAPLLSLCGKGVCFDTGGYDLKPSAGMLRMKKDMGGAAIMLGLARMVMAADLPVRLVLRLGCVENSVSGRAMRPSDVLATRRGLLWKSATPTPRAAWCYATCWPKPPTSAGLLIDAATLTGAARVALGPRPGGDVQQRRRRGEAMRGGGSRLPRPGLAAAALARLRVVAIEQGGRPEQRGRQTHGRGDRRGLYLQRFVTAGDPWIHLDTYAWTDIRPSGTSRGR